MKLDMSKPYGVVSGVDAASFEQGGRQFDANGDELGQGVEPAAKNKPGRKPKVIDAVADDENAEASPVDAQLAAQGV